MVVKLVNKSISGRRERSGGMLASGYKVGIGGRETKGTVGARKFARILRLRITDWRGRVREIKNPELLCGDCGRCRLYFLLVFPGEASGYRVGQDSRSEMDEILRERGRILHVADGGNGWDALHRGKQDVCAGRFERFAVGISRGSARFDRKRRISGRRPKHLFQYGEQSVFVDVFGDETVGDKLRRSVEDGIERPRRDV